MGIGVVIVALSLCGAVTTTVIPVAVGASVPPPTATIPTIPQNHHFR